MPPPILILLLPLPRVVRGARRSPLVSRSSSPECRARLANARSVTTGCLVEAHCELASSRLVDSRVRLAGACPVTWSSLVAWSTLSHEVCWVAAGWLVNARFEACLRLPGPLYGCPVDAGTRLADTCPVLSLVAWSTLAARLTSILLWWPLIAWLTLT